MDTRQTREQWILWLTDERMITPSVMIDANLGIDVENGELAIPIKDADGTFLFNKYRRSPWRDNGPKYRYPQGSTAQLYGAETLASLEKNTLVVICEGELDALALRSLGYVAVSTTGGSSTWKPEWEEHFKELNPVIMYDADQAGVEGALRVASMLPHASIAWLEEGHGKDITDVIKAAGAEAIQRAIDNRKIYRLAQEGMTNSTNVGRLISTRSVLNAERTALIQDRTRTQVLTEYAIAYVGRQINMYKDEERRKKSVASGDTTGDALERARRYPIAKLIKVGRMGFAQCVFHQEKTASLKVYPDHVYCFGCSRRGDAIDIYMVLNNCDFKTAVAALS